MNNNTNLTKFTSQQNEIVMQPPLYFAQQHVWNIAFHPTADIVACSQISVLASCSQDKRLGFMDGSGKVAHIIKKAHQTGINRVHFLDDQTVVSGDDDGIIKVWDLRTATSVFMADNQTEAITGFAYDQQIAQGVIYTSCLNGTVAAYDMRQPTDSLSKVVCLSDSTDQQLHGIVMVKNGKYLACPSSQGSILLFKRDFPQHYIQRIQGQPGSVDAILKIDQNTVISGSQDGFIRGVSIMPNKLLHTLGQHQEQENFPIQSISISRCKRFAASSSHDNSIKFYDINQFVQNRLKFQAGQQMSSMEMDQSESTFKWEVKKQTVDSDFEDDSDDSDQMQQSQEQKKKKKKKNSKMSLKNRQKQLKKQNVKSFFKGL